MLDEMQKTISMTDLAKHGERIAKDIASRKTVYRINLSGGKATAIFREGNKAAGATQGTPKLLAVGGRDLLMLDSKNIL